MTIIALIIVCLVGAFIATVISGVLFQNKMPDVQNYAGPMMLAAFLLAMAIGIMMIRQDTKNIKQTQETAYEQGYKVGFEKGKEEGYRDGYADCEWEYEENGWHK